MVKRGKEGKKDGVKEGRIKCMKEKEKRTGRKMKVRRKGKRKVCSNEINDGMRKKGME